MELGKNHIRIRNDPKVEELNLTKEQIDTIHKTIPKHRANNNIRTRIIKNVSGAPPCCCCRNIPEYKLTYRFGKAILIESYCKSCLNQVYQRSLVEPAALKDIPGFYHCQAGNIPKTPTPIENTPTVNYRRSRRY